LFSGFGIVNYQSNRKRKFVIMPNTTKISDKATLVACRMCFVDLSISCVKANRQLDKLGVGMLLTSTRLCYYAVLVL
jgi:hypothetical protein